MNIVSRFPLSNLFGKDSKAPAENKEQTAAPNKQENLKSWATASIAPPPISRSNSDAPPMFIAAREEGNRFAHAVDMSDHPLPPCAM